MKLILALIVCSFVLVSGRASACSCVGVANAEEFVEKVGVIFDGTVLYVWLFPADEHGGKLGLALLSVENSYTAKLGEIVLVSFHRGMCGADFTQGERGRFFADQHEAGHFSSNFCTDLGYFWTPFRREVDQKLGMSPIEEALPEMDRWWEE